MPGSPSLLGWVPDSFHHYSMWPSPALPIRGCHQFAVACGGELGTLWVVRRSVEAQRGHGMPRKGWFWLSLAVKGTGVLIFYKSEEKAEAQSAVRHGMRRVHIGNRFWRLIHGEMWILLLCSIRLGPLCLVPMTSIPMCNEQCARPGMRLSRKGVEGVVPKAVPGG